MHWTLSEKSTIVECVHVCVGRGHSGVAYSRLASEYVQDRAGVSSPRWVIAALIEAHLKTEIIGGFTKLLFILLLISTLIMGRPLTFK